MSFVVGLSCPALSLLSGPCLSIDSYRPPMGFLWGFHDGDDGDYHHPNIHMVYDGD